MLYRRYTAEVTEDTYGAQHRLDSSRDHLGTLLKFLTIGPSTRISITLSQLEIDILPLLRDMRLT